MMMPGDELELCALTMRQFEYNGFTIVISKTGDREWWAEVEGWGARLYSTEQQAAAEARAWCRAASGEPDVGFHFAEWAPERHHRLAVHRRRPNDRLAGSWLFGRR